MRTLAALEHHHGHLFNWYDTRTLEPLPPRYVSSVDSGNLAGHLLGAGQHLPGVGGGSRARLGPQPRHRRRGRADPRSPLADARPRTPLTAGSRGLGIGVAARRRGRRPSTTSARARGPPPAAWPRWTRPSRAWPRLAPDSVRGRAPGSTRPAGSVASLQRDAALTSAGPPRDRRAPRVGRPSRRAGSSTPWTSRFLLDRRRELLSVGFQVGPGQARRELLRPAGLRMPTGQLRRHRQGRRPDPALVPPRPRRSPRRAAAPPCCPGPDRCSSTSCRRWSCAPRRPACSAAPLDGSCAGRSTYGHGPRRALGHLRVGLQRPRPRSTTTSTRRSGSPASASSAGSPTTSSSPPTRPGSPSMIEPAAAAENYRAWPRSAPAGATATTRRSTTPGPGCGEDQEFAIVRSFMAHHQGMTIVAIHNVIHDGLMRERFHAEPIVRATELLLQERAPRDVPITHAHAEEAGPAASRARDRRRRPSGRSTGAAATSPGAAPDVQRDGSA